MSKGLHGQIWYDTGLFGTSDSSGEKIKNVSNIEIILSGVDNTNVTGFPGEKPVALKWGNLVILLKCSTKECFRNHWFYMPFGLFGTGGFVNEREAIIDTYDLDFEKKHIHFCERCGAKVEVSIFDMVATINNQLKLGAKEMENYEDKGELMSG